MESGRPRINHQPFRPAGHSSKSNMICKKHPKHRQSPGVCSVCLREKLSQLSSNNTTTTTTASSSSSSSSLSSLSSQYSSDASSCSSPAPMPVARRDGLNMLSKSRSLAFITRRRIRDREHNGDVRSKNKTGFWSKLLRPGSKRIDDGLKYSRTMRERMTTRVY